MPFLLAFLIERPEYLTEPVRLFSFLVFSVYPLGIGGPRRPLLVPSNIRPRNTRRAKSRQRGQDPIGKSSRGTRYRRKESGTRDRSGFAAGDSVPSSEAQRSGIPPIGWGNRPPCPPTYRTGLFRHSSRSASNGGAAQTKNRDTVVVMPVSNG